MANIFESAFMTLKNGMTMYFADSKARQWLQKLQGALAKKYGPDNPPPATEGGRIWYATCSTASGTGAKTAATTTGDFDLATGSMVRILFTTSNTVANPTISIDGSDAKAIRPISSSSGMANKIAAGEVIDLVYDGSNFVMTKGNAATTSFYGITKLNSSTSSTSTSEAATPSAVKDAYDLAASKASVPVAIADGGTGATSASAANANLHNYNLLEGVQLSYNTDLNTIVTPNIYRTTSDSNTASLVNKPPVTQPFQLAVMYIYGDYAVMQHVNEWLTGNEWRRFGYISGGSWTWVAWQKISAAVKAGSLYESNMSTSSGTIMSGSAVTYSYDNNFVSINYHVRLKDTTGRPTVTVTGLPNMGSGYSRSGNPTLVRIGTSTGASDSTYATISGTTMTINMTNFIGVVPSGTGYMAYNGSFVVPAAP